MAVSNAKKDAKDHWAVLVAGSRQFYNYRHQADVHHAQQLLLSQGVPEDQIILMVYDDIADSVQNPLPGQLFNKPDGPNVYDKEAITYSKGDVTADNLVAVLTGDSETTGGKPVLQSDENSRVFFFFADHGAPGFVMMPDGHYLYADTIQKAIDTMKEKKMFEDMVIYIEACESGSMFPNLSSTDGVYAMTASNALVSSWAEYCAPYDVVNDVKIGTCLGDLFSVSWMEDSEKNFQQHETIGQQHETVKFRTDQSPVMEFGELDKKNKHVNEFQGGEAESNLLKSWTAAAKNYVQDTTTKWLGNPTTSSTVDSRDAKLRFLTTKIERTNLKPGFFSSSEETHKELQAELQHRMRTDDIFKTVFADQEGMELDVQPTDFDCLRFMVNTHDEACGSFEDYSLKYVRHLVHTCENGTPEEINAKAAQLASACLQLEVIM